MAVRVDKARVERAAAEVHNLAAAGPGVLKHVLAASKAVDAPVGHANRFGARAGVGKGDDVGPDIDRLFPCQHEQAPSGVARRTGAGTAAVKGKRTRLECPFRVIVLFYTSSSPPKRGGTVLMKTKEIGPLRPHGKTSSVLWEKVRHGGRRGLRHLDKK